MNENPHPVAGVDYPETSQKFDDWFATEEACLDYMVKVRWPEGFRCPSCGVKTESPSLMGRGLFLCRECKTQTSVTSGTLFHRTHRPLRQWFLAMWYVARQEHGANALELQRVLGLGSYNTAWLWLHKLRRAMVGPKRDRLRGTVEVGDTYVAGSGGGIGDHGVRREAIVAIAVEVKGRGSGRVRLSLIPDLSAVSWLWFVFTKIERGANIRAPEGPGYDSLKELNGYKVKKASVHGTLPRVDRVASLLDQWWMELYKSGIRPSHLDYYLDEFAFRFNHRAAKTPGLLFYRLMEQAIACGPMLRRSIRSGRNVEEKAVEQG